MDHTTYTPPHPGLPRYSSWNSDTPVLHLLPLAASKVESHAKPVELTLPEATLQPGRQDEPPVVQKFEQFLKDLASQLGSTKDAKAPLSVTVSGNAFRAKEIQSVAQTMRNSETVVVIKACGIVSGRSDDEGLEVLDLLLEGCSSLPQLKELDISMNAMALHPYPLRYLPSIRSLRTFRASDCGLGSRGGKYALKMIEKAGTVGVRLSVVELANTGLGKEGATSGKECLAAFQDAEEGHVKGLRDGTDPGKVGAHMATAEQHYQANWRRQRPHIFNVDLFDEEEGRIARASIGSYLADAVLANNISLTSLNIHSNALTPYDFEAFFSKINIDLPSLKTLNIWNNTLACEASVDGPRVEPDSTIVEQEGNEIFIGACRRMGSFLSHCPRLRSLNLGYNSLDDPHSMKLVLDGIMQGDLSGLLDLSLEGNDASMTALATITEAFQIQSLPALKFIKLNEVVGGEVYIEAFLEALQARVEGFRVSFAGDDEEDDTLEGSGISLDCFPQLGFISVTQIETSQSSFQPPAVATKPFSFNNVVSQARVFWEPKYLKALDMQLSEILRTVGQEDKQPDLHQSTRLLGRRDAEKRFPADLIAIASEQILEYGGHDLVKDQALLNRVVKIYAQQAALALVAKHLDLGSSYRADNTSKLFRLHESSLAQLTRSYFSELSLVEPQSIWKAHMRKIFNFDTYPSAKLLVSNAAAFLAGRDVDMDEGGSGPEDGDAKPTQVLGLDLGETSSGSGTHQRPLPPHLAASSSATRSPPPHLPHPDASPQLKSSSSSTAPDSPSASLRSPPHTRTGTSSPGRRSATIDAATPSRHRSAAPDTSPGARTR